MSKYVRRLNVYINQEQDDKIRASGQSDSEYVRDAIDEKNQRMSDIKHRMKLQVLDELIKDLSDKKEELVRQNVRQVYKENSEFVRQTVENEGLVRQKSEKLSDKSDENVRQYLEDLFGTHLQTVVNLLYYNGKLNPTQQSIVSKNTGLSKKEVRDLIDEYHDELIRMVPHATQ